MFTGKKTNTVYHLKFTGKLRSRQKNTGKKTITVYRSNFTGKLRSRQKKTGKLRYRQKITASPRYRQKYTIFKVFTADQLYGGHVFSGWVVSNLLGFWDRRGTASICPTTG